MWGKSFEAVGLLPPQSIVSYQRQSIFHIALALLVAFIDNLGCPDLHRPVNKYCAQKSMKDSRRELRISLFFYEHKI